MTDKKTAITYADAGVDIDAGNALVERIKPAAKRTNRPGVMAGLGGFGALFDLKAAGYKDPVLVAATDGVGTKLRIAIDTGNVETIGIDLVAMCVNDLVCQGAEPLFFLDYFATGKLEVEEAADVVRGIAAGCEQGGCALIGGETAEMPGMYAVGDYDLAGFAVGVVERDAILGPERVRPGDALIGIASSGPHSNGYSLVRKLLEVSGADLSDDLDGRNLGEALLAPTRIYVKPLLALLRGGFELHALAHITGGGLPENLPRVLPENTRAQVALDSWERPAVFRWLQQQGNVAEPELLRTFNCGVGMVLALPGEQADGAIAQLGEAGEQAWRLGRIEAATGSPTVEFSGGEDG